MPIKYRQKLGRKLRTIKKQIQKEHSLKFASRAGSRVKPLPMPKAPSRAQQTARKFCSADPTVKSDSVLFHEKNKVAAIELAKKRNLEQKQQTQKCSESAVKTALSAAKVFKKRLTTMRENERELARASLDKIKKTVEIDNSDLSVYLKEQGFSWLA